MSNGWDCLVSKWLLVGMSFSFQWSWYLNNSSAVAAPENLFTMVDLINIDITLLVCLYIYLCLFVFGFVCLVSLSVYLSAYMAVCLSVCLCVYVSVCVSMCLCFSVCLSVHPSIRLCLSVCPSLSVCLSVCPSVCLSVCLSAIALYCICFQEQLAKGPPVTTTSNSCCNKMGENQCRFRPGMRLEALDKKHPTMICVATVQNVQNHQLLIHFDGWSDMYDYWCKCTSTDIHPIGYCQRAGRKLEPPKGISYLCLYVRTCVCVCVYGEGQNMMWL